MEIFFRNPSVKSGTKRKVARKDNGWESDLVWDTIWKTDSMTIPITRLHRVKGSRNK